MKTLRVYDNPRCVERYTVLLPNYRLDTGEIFLEILSVTERGNTFFCGDWRGGSTKGLGKKIQYSDLPGEVRGAIKSRLLQGH